MKMVRSTWRGMTRPVSFWVQGDLPPEEGGPRGPEPTRFGVYSNTRLKD